MGDGRSPLSLEDAKKLCQEPDPSTKVKLFIPKFFFLIIFICNISVGLLIPTNNVPNKRPKNHDTFLHGRPWYETFAKTRFSHNEILSLFHGVRGSERYGRGIG